MYMTYMLCIHLGIMDEICTLCIIGYQSVTFVKEILHN